MSFLGWRWHNPHMEANLGGLYGIVCVVEALTANYGLTSGSIIVGCDGQERYISPSSIPVP
eukprot:scaffold3244_cov37-Attheya_sp.AAC.1